MSNLGINNNNSISKPEPVKQVDKKTDDKTPVQKEQTPALTSDQYSGTNMCANQEVPKVCLFPEDEHLTDKNAINPSQKIENDVPERSEKDRRVTERKGTMFANWGWNRAAYTQSDINFRGPGYNFTLYNVDAHDKQTPFNFETYFSPTKLSIPQTNGRIGYYFDNKHSIAIGVDHMKYKMINNQPMNISGTISPEASQQYAGTYNNDPIVVTPDFLTYQHCDGLNQAFVELGTTEPIWESKNGQHALSFTGSLSGGPVVPDTEADLFGKEGDHHFHFAGYGAGAKVGLRADFFKYFFIEGNVKGGYINLPDVLVSAPDNKASQSFEYMQASAVFGANIPINTKKK
jgi:hypothetical protein